MFILVILDEANEMLIGWRHDSGLTFFVKNLRMPLELSRDDSELSLWKGWNKHCFTWKAGGMLKVWLLLFFYLTVNYAIILI